MNDWKSVLKADPIPWLLEPENPSVRYFALTDLLEHPQDDPQVVAAKKESLRSLVWQWRLKGGAAWPLHLHTNRSCGENFCRVVTVRYQSG